MSKIHPDCPDLDTFDQSVVADVFLRHEPDEEEDEEEDEGDSKEDDDDDQDDNGYSEWEAAPSKATLRDSCVMKNMFGDSPRHSREI